MTFMDGLRSGRNKYHDIEDYIEMWHDDPNPFGPKLHEYLGLTWEEYKRWVETGELPEE